MAQRKVETKVKAAGGTALVASFVVAWVVYKAPMLSALADPLQATLVGVLTSGAAGAAGWLAKHTPRPGAAAQTPAERPYGG